MKDQFDSIFRNRNGICVGRSFVVTSVPRKWYGGTKRNRTLPMLAPQAPIPTKKHWPFSPAEEGFTRFTTRLDCLPQMVHYEF